VGMIRCVMGICSSPQLQKIAIHWLDCCETPSNSEMGHFQPIDDVCAKSAFHPIATELLHYGK
jgi:hypothetical protein